jgi:hypothetical protein
MLSLSPARAQDDPTHYWSYRLLIPFDNPTTFQARDQFFNQYIDLVAFRQERFLNPAWKRHNGVEYAPLDSTAHLSWWDLSDVSFTTTVYVDNQFGSNQELHVEYLDAILLPARKGETPDLPPLPTNINHYLVYRVIGPAPGVEVDLRDQFQQQFNVIVGPAAFLCNPAWKQHAGIEYAPADSINHLVLYQVNSVHTEAPRFMNDQFLPQANYTDFLQEGDEYLAVPSLKHHGSTPTERSSWGKIKIIKK